MCSIPGGDRGPANAYKNHLKSLRTSKSLIVNEITNINNISELSNYNIFWFYVRFNPNLYYYIKQNIKKAKFIMGPNVLFEKPEIGPSDNWEKWFINEVKCDVYLNKASYYLEHVRKFFKNSKKYITLENCLDIKNYDQSSITNKDIDYLVYYKKRRIDNNFDLVFNNINKKIKDLNFKTKEINYGNYSKDEYFNLLKRSKFCLWLSIEDICANGQMESLYNNCIPIGTKYSNTISLKKEYQVNCAIFNQWIEWENNASLKFIECIKQTNLNYNRDALDIKDFLNNRLSYESYINLVESFL